MHIVDYGIQRSPRRRVFTLLAFIAVSFWFLQAGSNVVSSDAAILGADKQTISLSALAGTFSDIADRVEPGVVSITSIQHAAGLAGGSSSSASNEEADTNGSPQDSLPNVRNGVKSLPPLALDMPTRASGSGIIVRKEGPNYYILTNYHVVESAYQVSIKLWDDTEMKGIVIGLDPTTDLAVVQVASAALSERNIVQLGDSNGVKVGQWALAVGSPYGFEHTLTVGIVSALHRDLDDDGSSYPDLIQTDAAINKGNSGGPLLDVDGQVIGINTAIASPTGGFIGLGFALPINAAKSVLDDLIQNGYVIRGWLGLDIQDMTPVLSDYYSVQNGVLVAGVDSKGPGSAAGLQSEDVITSYNDERVSSVRQFQLMVNNTKPGTTAKLVVHRGGGDILISAHIALSPTASASRPSPPTSAKQRTITVRTLPGDIAKSAGLRNTTGVMVLDIPTGCAADDAGLDEGDIVVRVNGQSVSDERQFADIMRRITPGSNVVLKVIRDGSVRIIGYHAD